MSYEGGYYLNSQEFCRTGIHAHSSGLEKPFSDITLSTVNAIQNTPWMINTWVLDIMQEAWANGDLLGNLPELFDQAVPDRLPDEVWDRMEVADRREHNIRRLKIHERNAESMASRVSFLSKLSIAQEMKAFPAIWFPHFVDFRGRIYPMTADLHPQGDDISKSLLMFQEGLPLGDSGLQWLAIRLANNAGQDKMPLKQRIEWAFDHLRQINDSVDNPLDGERWWSDFKDDEPWQLLATCREFSMAVAMGDRAEEFISHLPINLDATASGLQHLSAIGRDSHGARMTNMTGDATRQDIYMAVNDVVKRLISDDAVSGNKIAHQWVGRTTRSTVKRAVMTTPYGVTDRGIRDQLLNDGHAKHIEDRDRSEAASYLRDKIVAALSSTVSAAKEIMAWIQAVAEALTERGYPLRWVTPTGDHIQQTYYNLARKKVSTLLGEQILWEEDRTLGLNVNKNMMASAPNVIHSFDASHLKLVVMELIRRGITSYSMIHDSFGVHACHTSMMSKIIREKFVEMYSKDVLKEFEDYIRSYAPDVELPPRPELGDFDITEVMKSEYFFS